MIITKKLLTYSIDIRENNVVLHLFNLPMLLVSFVLHRNIIYINL